MKLGFNNDKDIVFGEVISRVGCGRIHENCSITLNTDLYERHVTILLGYEINGCSRNSWSLSTFKISSPLFL